MAQKIIRDPVHDAIAFQLSNPLEKLLFDLVNSAEFQRLRRIRQLGLASLAYPGADHSRYSHSLGVMETARKILAALRRGIAIEPEMEELCLIAALLHDLGHGPFSHVFERISGIDHEAVTRRVILDPQSQVHQVLGRYRTGLPQEVVGFIDGRPRRRFYHDILSSELDADRCDYLLRDSLNTGSRYGDYDLNWLLHALVVDSAGDRLAVAHKGISAVEGFLQSRYHMYRNVYFHKVVRSAEGMVRLALQRAKRLAVQQRLAFPPPHHPLHQALTGQTLNMAQWVLLDDLTMLECFKAWSSGPDAMLASLCGGLLFRRLFKVIDLSHLQDATALDRIYQAARQAVTDAGGDAAYELFLDEPGDTPYESFRPDGSCSGNGITVCDAAGRAWDFAVLSPLSTALAQPLVFRRLHVAEPRKAAVVQAIAAVIGQ
jgi:HD superfamily phosphohydrolase